MIGQNDSLLREEIDGYYIEKLIGQGGMARVYRGRDVRLGRYIVFKVIKSGARANEGYRKRFEVEAQAIALLEHPHIVQIYRFGEVGDLYYMAMQYIEGVDLSAILKDYANDNELLPHSDLLRIVSQVGAALDYAHSKGIIHRDVKPANIMLDLHGDATLTDFGLALLEAKGSHGEVFGTPHYMAPEQVVSSAGAIPQSDLYSLGVILYEMLTGNLPFNGNTAMEIAMLHLTEQPPSPLDRNPSLHPAFLPILDKLLQKEAVNRYQSGEELSAALREAVVAASSAPHSIQATPFHISNLEIPEKVSQIRKSQPLLPRLTPSSTPLNASKLNISLPKLFAGQQWPGQHSKSLLVGGLTAVAVLGIVLVIMLSLFNREVGRVLPTTMASPISVEPTVAPATLPVLEGISPTTLPLDSTSIVVVTPIQTPLALTPGAISVSPDAVALRFVTNGEDSLYVMNISPSPIDVGLLELRGSQSGGVLGTEWGIGILNNQECVRILKDDNAVAPNVTCSPVGNLLTRDGPTRFWKPEFGSFEVYYAGILIGNCSTEGCVLPIAELAS